MKMMPMAEVLPHIPGDTLMAPQEVLPENLRGDSGSLSKGWPLCSGGHLAPASPQCTWAGGRENQHPSLLWSPGLATETATCCAWQVRSSNLAPHAHILSDERGPLSPERVRGTNMAGQTRAALPGTEAPTTVLLCVTPQPGLGATVPGCRLHVGVAADPSSLRARHAALPGGS